MSVISQVTIYTGNLTKYIHYIYTELRMVYYFVKQVIKETFIQTKIIEKKNYDFDRYFLGQQCPEPVPRNRRVLWLHRTGQGSINDQL